MDRVNALCTKCGWFKMRFTTVEDYKKCPMCGAILDFPDLDEKTFISMSQEEKDNYRTQYMNGKTFDEEFLQKRLQRERQIAEEVDERFAKSKPEIQCPYCHSRNTKKISTAGRLFSVGFFGLGSSKVGKQWHCNKCGSDF